MGMALCGGASDDRKAATHENQDAAKSSILHHTDLCGIEQAF